MLVQIVIPEFALQIIVPEQLLKIGHSFVQCKQPLMRDGEEFGPVRFGIKRRQLRFDERK